MAKIKKKIRKLNIGVEVLQEFYLKEEKIDQINYEDEIEYFNPKISEEGGGDLPVLPVYGKIRVSNVTEEEIEDYTFQVSDSLYYETMSGKYNKMLAVEVFSGTYTNAMSDNTVVTLTRGETYREVYRITEPDWYTTNHILTQGLSAYYVKEVNAEENKYDLIVYPTAEDIATQTDKYEWAIPLGKILAYAPGYEQIGGEINYRSLLYKDIPEYIVNNTTDFVPTNWKDTFVFVASDTDEDGKYDTVSYDLRNGLPIVKQDGTVLEVAAPAPVYAKQDSKLYTNEISTTCVIDSLTLSRDDCYIRYDSESGEWIPSVNTGEFLKNTFNSGAPDNLKASVKMELYVAADDPSLVEVSSTSSSAKYRYDNFTQNMEVEATIVVPESTSSLNNFRLNLVTLSDDSTSTEKFILPDGAEYASITDLNTVLPTLTQEEISITYKKTVNAPNLVGTMYSTATSTLEVIYVNGNKTYNFCGNCGVSSAGQVNSSSTTYKSPRVKVTSFPAYLVYYMQEGHCVNTFFYQGTPAEDQEDLGVFYSPILLEVTQYHVKERFEDYNLPV